MTDSTLDNQDKPLWMLRPLEKGDESFVYASWLKSYRDAPAMKNVRNSVYFKRQHDVIEYLFGKDLVTGIVACNPENRNEIYGYIIGEYRGSSVIVHWVYTKFSLRGFGVAKDLINNLTSLPNIDYKLFSCMPKMNATMSKKIEDSQFIYDPWLTYL